MNNLKIISVERILFKNNYWRIFYIITLKMTIDTEIKRCLRWSIVYLDRILFRQEKMTDCNIFFFPINLRLGVKKKLSEIIFLFKLLIFQTCPSESNQYSEKFVFLHLILCHVLVLKSFFLFTFIYFK